VIMGKIADEENKLFERFKTVDPKGEPYVHLPLTKKEQPQLMIADILAHFKDSGTLDLSKMSGACAARIEDISLQRNMDGEVSIRKKGKLLGFWQEAAGLKNAKILDGNELSAANGALTLHSIKRGNIPGSQVRLCA
jgi:hypothetical protein